jgi:hypothetical protein
MKLIDLIKKRILKFLGLEKLSENPYSERLTFIQDNENIELQQLREYKTWYLGSADELLNFYTNEELYGNAREPIYNRNRQNYFWGISATENTIKRVHSGIPHSIVFTLTNIIGDFKIETKDELLKARIEKISESNDLRFKINQEEMPLTMVEGWGAFKINFDMKLSNKPIIQFYEAMNCEFVYKSGCLLGIIYKDYYKYNGKNYVLLETRRKLNGDSLIEYELFRLEDGEEVKPVELSEIPDLADLQNIKIAGLNEVLGVPVKFFFDPYNKNYGRSVYAGKIGLFDDLDQILSQDSQTVRVSTPVEYYPVDLLERTKDGQPRMPKVFNRQYVAKESMPDGDGNSDGNIQTTQPDLNFDKYSQHAINKVDMILIGLMSPASLGLDIAKKDNAEAQREKEKATIMTRNNIIDRQQQVLKQLFSLSLMLEEYMETGVITLQDYDFNISYDEFANPSMENLMQVYGQAYADGCISTERYVELLWGDKLSDEEKAKEVELLEQNKKQDNLDLSDFEDGNPVDNTL